MIAEFKERILKAVEDGDLVYSGKLFKAMKLPSPPEPENERKRAAIEAFDELFLDGVRTTREEWPTKKMVRRPGRRL